MRPAATVPANRDALPEPSATLSSANRVIGDRVIGDRVIGDRVIGDRVIGDRVGDRVIGVNRAAGRLPAREFPIGVMIDDPVTRNQ